MPLFEKDYFCSVLLADLRVAFQQGLVFKGGTSLTKVYAEFYRLNEVLDFVIRRSYCANRKPAPVPKPKPRIMPKRNPCR